MSHVTIEGLSKKYGGKPPATAVDNLSLHIEEGEFLVNKNTPLHECSFSVGVSQFLLECKAEVDAVNAQ